MSRKTASEKMLQHPRDVHYTMKKNNHWTSP